MKRTAIVIGATGLVGRALISQLSLIYDCLIIIARRPPKLIHTSMYFYQLNDFTQLAQTIEPLNLGKHCDAFTCLGTTKKQAGGEAGFQQIDYGINLAFAQSCRQKGVERFFLLSAQGANPNSRFFYNRVKGELEVAITDLKFDELVIFRPSLLLGRHKSRPLENTAQLLYKAVKPLVPKSLKSRPITANRVAAAITVTAQNRYERHRFVSDYHKNESHKSGSQTHKNNSQAASNNQNNKINEDGGKEDSVTNKMVRDTLRVNNSLSINGAIKSKVKASPKVIIVSNQEMHDLI